MVVKRRLLAHNESVTTKEHFWEQQANAWAQRRRDGVTFNRIASDSQVSIPTVRWRLVQFGYSLKGEKDGGSGDQTTNPLTSTLVDALNGDKSTTTAHQGGV